MGSLLMRRVSLLSGFVHVPQLKGLTPTGRNLKWMPAVDRKLWSRETHIAGAVHPVERCGLIGRKRVQGYKVSGLAVDALPPGNTIIA